MTKVFVIDGDELFDENLSISSAIPSIAPAILLSEVESSESICSAPSLGNVPCTQATQVVPESDPQNNLEMEEIHHNTSKIDTISVEVEYPSNEQDDGINTSSDLEVEIFETSGIERACKRNEMFKSIIVNDSIDISWQELMLHTFGTIVISFLATTPCSLIPLHDLIEYPSYWYEIVILGAYSNSWRYGFRCLLGGFFMNISYIRIKMVFFSQIIIGFLQMFLLLVLSYFIWTQIYNYQFPVPFMGYTVTFCSNAANIVAIWFCFPKEWRQDGFVKKKMKSFVYLNGLIIFMNINYEIIVVIMKRCPSQYQPIFGFGLPALRAIWTRMSLQLIQTSPNEDLSAAALTLKYAISVAHSIGLCNTIGTVATETTSWILIAIDFFLNIYLAVRLVWMRKRHSSTMQQQIDVLQELVIYELVEFLVPPSYILVLGVTYFGPNGNLFGNIRSSIWTFSAIENINKTIMNMVGYFVVDFTSTLVSATILWAYCRINLWKACLQMQKEFGKFFMVSFSQLMISYLNRNLISWGHDFTGKFDWITT